MKKLFAFFDEYTQSLSCVNLAAIRLCMFGLGILLGLNTREEHKRPMGIISCAIAIGTGLNILIDLVLAAIRWCKSDCISADEDTV